MAMQSLQWTNHLKKKSEVEQWHKEGFQRTEARFNDCPLVISLKWRTKWQVTK